MPRGSALALLGLAATACVSPSGVEPAPIRAADFRPTQVRQPAVVVRLAFAGQLSEREREALPAEYEGALLEGLNTRAVLAKDVEILAQGDAKLDAHAALARARTLGADHAIVVDVRVATGEAIFCRESRRPFQTVTRARNGRGLSRQMSAVGEGLLCRESARRFLARVIVWSVS